MCVYPLTQEHEKARVERHLGHQGRASGILGLTAYLRRGSPSSLRWSVWRSLARWASSSPPAWRVGSSTNWVVGTSWLDDGRGCGRPGLLHEWRIVAGIDVGDQQVGGEGGAGKHRREQGGEEERTRGAPTYPSPLLGSHAGPPSTARMLARPTIGDIGLATPCPVRVQGTGKRSTSPGRCLRGCREGVSVAVLHRSDDRAGGRHWHHRGRGLKSTSTIVSRYATRGCLPPMRSAGCAIGRTGGTSVRATVPVSRSRSDRLW